MAQRKGSSSFTQTSFNLVTTWLDPYHWDTLTKDDCLNDLKKLVEIEDQIKHSPATFKGITTDHVKKAKDHIYRTRLRAIRARGGSKIIEMSNNWGVAFGRRPPLL